MIDYLKDPLAIYELSFQRVREATDLRAVPANLQELAVRVVHASACPEIITDLAWAHEPVRAAGDALGSGANVFVDSQMLAEGIIKRALPADNQIICTLNDERAYKLKETLQTTRSAAAVDLWCERLGGAVVVIGNAPTALFRLLELLAQGAPRPAVIFAFPVGFVGASESKQALVEEKLGIPYVTLLGRRGGSAIAAGAFNAINTERLQ